MITVELAARNFLKSSRVNGRSPNTVRWYGAMLRPLVSMYYSKDISKVTATDMRLLLVHLKEQEKRYQGATNRPEQEGGLSHESYRDYVRAYKRFFNWCIEEYELDNNPMRTIKMPPASKRTPAAISIDDFKRLVAACEDTPKGVRDRAILTFLLDTGCRAGGLLTLTTDMLDLEQNTAIVTEKGDRQRTVVFSELAKFYLERWLNIRPLNAGNVIFCSLHQKHIGKPLTMSGLHMMLNGLKKAAGVQGRVNPHSFRHAFARQYIESGGDLASLAQLMGHSSIEVTASFYAVFSQEELTRMHRRFSPLNQIRRKRDQNK